MEKENYEIWFEGTNIVNYPRAILPNETNVLIVGGGITGVTSAYLLAKAGKKPILLEQGKLGKYVTGRTTGFLSQIIDVNCKELIRQHGLDNANLVFKSHQSAIDDIEKIIISEKIDCGFERCSSYIYANTKKEETNLLKLVADYQKLGVSAEYKKDGTLKFNEFSYIEIFNQAKFDAIKYITSIAKIATMSGAIIAENTKVLNLNNQKDDVVVEVENVGIIKAKKVFLATYIPLGQKEYLSQKYNIYRSYVLEYKIPKNILINGTYQDALEPYHYFRVDRNNDFDRLIIGGNDNLEILNVDHEIGAKIIKDYTKRLFSAESSHLLNWNDDDFSEIRHWSGMISEPVDRLACIGESKGGNIFYAFGFSGNGLTYSYIASKIFTDELTGQNNSYSKIYSTDNKISWWKKLF